MVQVDLITGFLGSGKTTFMRHYARYMVQQGWNVCILENDFGAVNVDVMLLQDILGDHCDMESISGGCDCDTHQRRMRTKLISLAMQGFDRVIIEPSGIFDVDEERAKHLVNEKVAEIVNETEKTTEKAAGKGKE